jgi:protease-4
MKRKFYTGLILFLILVLAAFLIVKELASGDIMSPGGGHVALIYAEGEIVSASDPGTPILGGALVSSVDIVEKLENARKDSKAKAVLLRIDSPGGSAAASQEIYTEIARVVKEKPVVVSMGDICASGGYYISSASSYIFANPSTLTGSIGVISQFTDMSALMAKIGVNNLTLKAGTFKDVGNPYRAMTDAEKAIMQQMLNEVYAQFINDVAAGRKMKPEQVRKLAEGMIYNGSDALKLKLVDELGGLEAAKAKALALGKLPADGKVLAYQTKRNMFNLLSLLGSKWGGGSPQSSLTLDYREPSALQILASRMMLSDIGTGR